MSTAIKTFRADAVFSSVAEAMPPIYHELQKLYNTPLNATPA